MADSKVGEMQHYRVREVQQLLGVSRSKVYELMSSRQLAYVQIGRCRRISHTALTTLLEQIARK